MAELISSRLMWLTRVIWIAYAVALLIATHISIPDHLENLVSVYDKLLHFGAYFGLGILTYFSLMNWRTGKLSLLLVYIGLLVFAAQDEYLQGFVNRTPDIKDWLADATATLIALCGSRFVLPRWIGSHSAVGGLSVETGSSPLAE